MKIKKIKITNLYGITEYEADGKSVELSGSNGVGKSSVIDAIRAALTNKSNRKYIVRNGETEGEILIETDNGLRINRKFRTNQADYKSVKQNGREVGSPESFLRDIFSPLQLSPVEFMEKSEKEQNAIILDMIQYDWNLQTIGEWFGEIPDWVSYDQNILSILNEYARMKSLQDEVEILQQDSQELTNKIEKARMLPGEILETATIPIKGLTVKNGIPLINGLPISNLSDGEKLDLCIDVAIQKPNGLQIILIDGVEKLSTKMRGELYRKCKEKGLQFIATRTTDDEDLTVVQL